MDNEFVGLMMPHKAEQDTGGIETPSGFSPSSFFLLPSIESQNRSELLFLQRCT